MAAGVKPTRIYLQGASLPDEVSIEGVYTGDDVDWDEAPGVGGQDQWKQPVRCATTANVTIATALNAGDTLDGVTLAAGDRVLVKNQSTASQNGIYLVSATPARAPDMDEDEEVLGAAVYVIAGTANAGTAWAVTTTTAVTVDTDAIAWAQVGGAGTSGPDTSLVTVAATGAAETVDVSVARTYDLTLDADCTLTLSGAVTAEAHFVTIIARQDGFGGWDLTWPGSVAWPGGVTPVPDTTASTATVYTLFTLDGGTAWFGFMSGAGEPTADAHIADTTDAHDASAISVADSGGNFTGTDVEAVLAELASAVPTGHYEVIVSGSAPPVAVTNVAEDDWTYGWVED